MSQLVAQLTERRRVLLAEGKSLADVAAFANRAFTEAEEKRYHQVIDEIDAIDKRTAEIDGEQQRAADTEAQFAAIRGTPAPKYPPALGDNGNPLHVTSQALDALQSAIVSRTAGLFVAGDEEQRAALVTTTFGAPRAWGSNVLSGPRLLHVAARVPLQRVDAVLAQLPTLTLPTAQGSVGENVSLAEYAASVAGSVNLARFGRWTDLSRESLVGTDAGAIVGAHTVGVALDLDLALITLVNTAAGAAVAFTADVPAAIRKAIALVTSNTAAGGAEDLVVLAHPDNTALLEDVTPVGGRTIAEGFNRFSGALVYPSTAVPTGFMLVANLIAGVRYFQARGLQMETDVAIKTGTFTVASSVIGGYGNALAGYVSKVDVVTP